MAIIGERDKDAVRKILQKMDRPVKLINFTQTFECDTCRDARMILEELVALSDKLSLEVLNLVIDKERAASYGVDKVPATIVEHDGRHGIRFYGAPAGYEFASLLDAIVLASSGSAELEPPSAAMIEAIMEPLHLEVLVTPT